MRVSNAPIAIAGGFLLLAAIFPWPYGFYSLMRLVVCACCAVVAFQAFESGRSSWAWCVGLIALVFNPVFPPRMGRSEWALLDWIGVAVLAALWVRSRMRRTRR